MRPLGLADVFVEWAGPVPEDRRSMFEIEEVGCFRLHGLDWQESFIADDGKHRLCHFRAPDAESVRIAFRQAGIRTDTVWSGTVTGRQDGASPMDVLIEWHFRPPWPADPPDALERARCEGLGPLGFRAVQGILPADRRRILCLGAAPAAMPAVPVRAWRFRRVAPSPVALPPTANLR